MLVAAKTLRRPMGPRFHFLLAEGLLLRLGGVGQQPEDRTRNEAGRNVMHRSFPRPE
jgi:hypothetical protein